jgi:riboflavin transporter FmnP
MMYFLLGLLVGVGVGAVMTILALLFSNNMEKPQ